MTCGTNNNQYSRGMGQQAVHREEQAKTDKNTLVTDLTATTPLITLEASNYDVKGGSRVASMERHMYPGQSTT